MKVDTGTIAWSLIIFCALAVLASWCILAREKTAAISFTQLLKIELLAGISGALCLGAYSVPSRTREINRARRRLTRIIEAGQLEIQTRRQIKTKPWDWAMLATCLSGIFLGGIVLHLEHLLLSAIGSSTAVRLILAGSFFAGGGFARALISEAAKGHLKGLNQAHQQACDQVARKISTSATNRPA